MAVGNDFVVAEVSDYGYRLGTPLEGVSRSQRRPSWRLACGRAAATRLHRTGALSRRLLGLLLPEAGPARYAGGVAGAVVMVIVLVVLFPVVVLVGSGIVAAALGSFLKADSDAANRSDDGPNEYLDLARKEAETGYPQIAEGHGGRRRLNLPGRLRRS